MNLLLKPFQGKTWILPGLVLAFVIVFSSCLKESQVQNGARKMIIAFGYQSIPYDKVDSAAAVFTKQGTTTPYYKRFVRQNGGFEMSMEDYTTGIWKIDIMMYTKKDTTGKSFEYTVSATFDVAQISGVLLGAPDSASSAVWDKHVVLSGPNNDVVNIIPLDLTDPAFTIIAKDIKWDSFAVRKVAYQTFTGDTTEVLSKTWNCTGDCLGSDKILYDTTAFKDFSQYIKTKTYNKGFVQVTAYDTETADTRTFTHWWNKQ